MPGKLRDTFEPAAPSANDAKLAQESSHRLAPYLRAKGKKDVRLRLVGSGAPAETITVPLAALRLFADILHEMAQGNAVGVIPIHAELTTQQAAGVLNVSRPFLIGLLDDGRIPSRKVGSHRRVLLRDVMGYKHKIDANRLKTLAELARQAQELDMGY